ncbi:hypothetical protein [Parachlamydia sp. AcF125]|uniref:MSCRAMM family protein n=1 Tax=Parachlamydia sp. AcF125 TaxID=2795736 RepID=UPI001BC9D50B|nr:hypothetical protein [Parachlamydia sp. AcF125]MBS4167582.1 hypothetical protein [Parachlamydia sp. AcF125]
MMCGFTYSGWADDTTGTLVVTYQTGVKGERLERVRFWLRKNDKDKQLYPASHASVEDLGKLSRTVVVENLIPGDYTLEFVIPNRDSFFYQPEIKQVKILAGQITKVNQTLQPRYVSIAVSAVTENHTLFDKLPIISLHTSSGKTVHCSSDGSLKADALEPGDYTVLFEELSGYICPQPLEIVLQPGEKAENMLGTYVPNQRMGLQTTALPSKEVGTLLLFYPLLVLGENEEQLKYRLKDSGGNFLLQESLTEVAHYRLKSGSLTVLRALPIGLYEVEFYVDESALPPKILSRKNFEVKRGEIHSLEMAFSSEEVAAFKEALSLHREMERREKELAFAHNPKAMQPAFLTIKCHGPDASWALYRRSILVYTGTGSVNRLKVPPGGPYVIKAAKKEDVEIHLSPKFPFFLEASKFFQVDIFYEKPLSKENLINNFSSLTPGHKMSYLSSRER